jgi:hypothetical protein
MGRKKKAKKIIKEALKKDKKKTKSAPKKVEKSLKPKKKIPLKKILAFLSFLFFSSVTAFMLIASFHANEIAKYFSEKDTILTFEINSDLKNINTEKSLTALFQNDLKNNLSSLFSTDYETKISPWIGRSAGFALIRNENMGLSQIYFIETKSVKKAFSILNINAKGTQIISLPEYYFPKNDYFEKPLFLTVIDSYLFFSPNQAALTKLLQMQNDTDKKLFKSPDFRKIKENSPSQRLAFLFVNSKYISALDLSAFSLPTGLLLSLSDVFTSEGLSVWEKSGDFYLTSFTTLSKPSPISQNVESKNFSFPYDKNLLAFFAFKNPKNFLTDILSVTNRLETLYPGAVSLLENEFAFSLSENGEIGIMIKSLDENENKTLADLVFSLAQSFEGFDRDIREQTLPDGTKYQEYVKVPKQILTTEKFHSGKKYLDFSGKIFLFQNGSESMVSTSEKHLTDLIDSTSKVSTKSALLKVNLEKAIKSATNPFSEMTLELMFKNGGIAGSSKLKIK